MTDWKRSLGQGSPADKVERRTLAASNASYISPEDARAYAESLLQGALYGRKAYSPEGLRKPLGRLSKEPWSDEAFTPGPRVGLSGLQRNLEDAKTELKRLLPKVSNHDGVSALNGIISSIQATQDRLDDDERKRVYEEPYKSEPQLRGEEGSPWDNPNRMRPISLREALSKWVE
ncbi:hypothetical protein [Sinorhizobium psoraleae]|uniref:Uncharacterized protein n=1 Tax=Sinorhizobium psoraleae TaxID=520838 RepID=A0ABT4KKS8_9HYPH|nr:hypothetical protein [Sinorhizobium psoraleae]MCZ4092560.1 hypothetical protein [Sinorhizobium psoraleae]NRP73973.1 hypothetical protein [Sinorhizobium psoraleae]